MRAIGTPLVVSDGRTSPLERIKIGKDGLHSERWLQELINDHPELLPMAQIEPALSSLVPVCMELPLRCGFLDNLFLTPDGEIVIVEVKLWQSHQMRRDVLAQALDYAAALFEMTYEELEQAVQNAETTRTGSLYEIVAGPTALEEPAFIDAVSHKLKTGRIVVLIAGDGIRCELEALTESLQAHAGFQFTFGLVELGVYRGSDERLTVVPQTLLATHRVERGIVSVEVEGAANVSMTTSSRSKPRREVQTLSSDAFYDAMNDLDPALPEQIRNLLTALEPLGVYPEYKKSLILRWGAPNGETANLGYIFKNGKVWTDAVASSLGRNQAAMDYLESMAKSFDCEIGEMSGQPLLKKNGTAPSISELVKAPDKWAKAVMTLRAKLQ